MVIYQIHVDGFAVCRATNKMRMRGRVSVLRQFRIPTIPIIVPPIFLDSSLANLLGSRREEVGDVSEYGRAERCGPLGEVGRPPQAMERAA
ncbi:MAG: hypothetical protein J4G03_08875, partial [Gemmatimonadetes bacterium]|nr:hypothetical protein [Gemmatimonadota bacterium]